MKIIMKTTGLTLILIIIASTLSAQQVGDPAPDFTYKNLSGEDVTLSSFTGKVVFLYLFGNTCPFCEASGNTTETMVYQVYKDRDDFQALGLDLWDGSMTLVQAFQAKTKVTYPLLLNAGSMAQKYSTTYDRVLVIDQEGVLRHKGTTPVSSGLTAAINVIDNLLVSTSIDLPEGKSPTGLEGIFPNPANGYARIRFHLDGETDLSIRLLNALGQEVQTITKGRFLSGAHTLEINTGNLPTGLYLVQMVLPERHFSRKLIVKR